MKNKARTAAKPPPINSIDEELIDECIKENAIAQEKLYKRWSGKLLAIPYRYTSSRTESIEILNTAFLKIFQSLQNYSAYENASFSAWMSKIVLHTTIDQLRENTSYKKKFVFNLNSDVAVENTAISKMTTEEILQLLSQLPVNTKTIFNLYVIEGYKHAEIGKMMNISTATSRWHLSEARKAMKELIRKHINN